MYTKYEENCVVRRALYMYILRTCGFLYFYEPHTQQENNCSHSILKFMHINTQRVGTYSLTVERRRKCENSNARWCAGRSGDGAPRAPTSACEGELANAAAASTTAALGRWLLISLRFGRWNYNLTRLLLSPRQLYLGPAALSHYAEISVNCDVHQLK